MPDTMTRPRVRVNPPKVTQLPRSGPKLKPTLQAYHITRARIAARAGVGEDYVSHWWNGRRAAPRIEWIARKMLVEAQLRAVRGQR